MGIRRCALHKHWICPPCIHSSPTNVIYFSLPRNPTNLNRLQSFVADPMRDVFSKHSQPHQTQQQSKDDAYAEFMREMEQMM